MPSFENLANTLFGSKRAETNSVLHDGETHTIIGTATGDSADGSVMVELSSDVTNPEELTIGDETYFSDASTSVELPTTEAVKEGDEVLVSIYGGTPLRSPVVTGVVGSGDRVAADAEAAREIAEATGQHFWHDDNGAHVTELPREEWEAQQSGPNSLWNSLGMLFRDGLNNLLAIVTGASPGLQIFDGHGNNDENILAKFYSYVNSLGNRAARVDFFNGAGYIDYSEGALSLNAHDTTYTGDQAQTCLEMRQANGGRTSSIWMNSAAYGAAAPVYIEAVSSGLYPDADRLEISAPKFVIGGYEQGAYLDGSYSISDILAAIPVELFSGTYAQTYNTSITLSETAANFSRLDILYEDSSGSRNSVTVSDPNGKLANCLMAVMTGTPYYYLKAKTYLINGTTIAVQDMGSYKRQGTARIGNNVATQANFNNEIGIVKVYGYR